MLLVKVMLLMGILDIQEHLQDLEEIKLELLGMTQKIVINKQ